MNRTLLFGIAIFFAIVGIALMGSDTKAIAGHGCYGCAGVIDCGCDGVVVQKYAGVVACGGPVDCCAMPRRVVVRRVVRDCCGPCDCCGPVVSCGCEGPIQKGVVQKGVVQKATPVQKGVPQKAVPQKAAPQKAPAVEGQKSVLPPKPEPVEKAAWNLDRAPTVFYVASYRR